MSVQKIYLTGKEIGERQTQRDTERLQPLVHSPGSLSDGHSGSTRSEWYRWVSQAVKLKQEGCCWAVPCLTRALDERGAVSSSPCSRVFIFISTWTFVGLSKINMAPISRTFPEMGRLNLRPLVHSPSGHSGQGQGQELGTQLSFPTWLVRTVTELSQLPPRADNLELGGTSHLIQALTLWGVRIAWAPAPSWDTQRKSPCFLGG